MTTKKKALPRSLAKLLEQLSAEGLVRVHVFAQKVLEREQSGGKASPLLADLSIQDFAREVQAAADQSQKPWGSKVFVSDLYAELEQRGSADDMSLDVFKERLLEAHRAMLLSMSRCDLVEAANPRDVEESEIRYMSATFHLVRRSSRPSY